MNDLDMGQPVKLYFAHPITDYGSDLEARAVAALARYFDVINPNAPEHQAAYSQSGMPYFIELASSCQACAFMRMPSGRIGAGVGKEIGSFLVDGWLVFEITRDCEMLSTLVMPVADTRAEIAQIRLANPASSARAAAPNPHPAPHAPRFATVSPPPS